MKTGHVNDPWTWMQPHDAARLGDVILEHDEQTRWCRAVMLGGLPYMWKQKANTIRDLLYDRLSLKAGDRVIIIGESIESCGFDSDIAKRVGTNGHVHAVDITDEARDAYFAGRRGSGGQLATWRWDYTKQFADGAFDSVAVLQAVQHADDWREIGAELLRILKPGGRVMLAEITMGPKMLMLAELDIHISYWMEKMFSRVGFKADQIPYHSLEQLRSAFSGLVEDADALEWKGLEAFWGTKPKA